MCHFSPQSSALLFTPRFDMQILFPPAPPPFPFTIYSSFNFLPLSPCCFPFSCFGSAPSPFLKREELGKGKDFLTDWHFGVKVISR